MKNTSIAVHLNYTIPLSLFNGLVTCDVEMMFFVHDEGVDSDLSEYSNIHFYGKPQPIESYKDMDAFTQSLESVGLLFYEEVERELEKVVGDEFKASLFEKYKHITQKLN